MNKRFDLLALGEVLLRLSPQGGERLTQGETLNKQVGGAELNVVSGASLLGLHTGIISKLPANSIGIYAKNKIRFCGVSDDYLAYDNSSDARLGVYYYENGSFPRKPGIVYDRLHTSFQKISVFDFSERLYSSARCFHTSGITLALSQLCQDTAIEMIRLFKEHGALISFDVNYRQNLWSGFQAKTCIQQILPLVDIFFCSEDTARLTFDKKGDTKSILKSFTQDYPISIVASTKRVVHSPRFHTFGSVIYDSRTDTFYEEEPYRNIEVIDRIGSGDAYISGVLYGLLSEPQSCQRALEIGNAVSALKNTVFGDLPSFTPQEIDSVIQAHKTPEVQSEMNR